VEVVRLPERGLSLLFAIGPSVSISNEARLARIVWGDGHVIVDPRPSRRGLRTASPATRPPTASAASTRSHCPPERLGSEEGKAEAGVDEIARRYVYSGKVGHSGLESQTELRRCGGPERLDRTGLSIYRQNAPACSQELSRVSARPAAKVYGETLARVFGIVCGE